MKKSYVRWPPPPDTPLPFLILWVAHSLTGWSDIVATTPLRASSDSFTSSTVQQPRHIRSVSQITQQASFALPRQKFFIKLRVGTWLATSAIPRTNEEHRHTTQTHITTHKVHLTTNVVDCESKGTENGQRQSKSGTKHLCLIPLALFSLVQLLLAHYEIDHK
jgi:hypothetical protein